MTETDGFKPRDWQERFLRIYQTNLKENFLLEACTGAGKTASSLYVYVSLKDILDWKFIIIVVPSEHLKRQYALDAHNLFGLNLYYSGTEKRLGRIPTPSELLSQNYKGIVVSYQWLCKNDNAEYLRNELSKNQGKIFLVLDEVHHASSELAFGQACKTAFSNNIVSHRLMTSGTPFRSDNNKILGNWLNYEQIEEDVYECRPDFRYTLADALQNGIIPPFAFVTMEGEFTYCRDGAKYVAKTFDNAISRQELVDALNTAIYVQGDWVKEAILWAHKRMQADRAKGLPECATYIRVSTIDAARKMRERVRRLTGEDALVVVSKDEDPTILTKVDPSELIEQFAAEKGASSCSWIIGVGMLGEGISINRLKYRIHASNICTPLAFRQDLGRLLRLFPQDNPESVEVLIPAHPTLIKFALEIMNEVAHVIEITNDPELENLEKMLNENNSLTSKMFIPIASTGELGNYIVDGEEIVSTYTSVAEWAISNKEIWRHWGKTPAHLAQMLAKDEKLFELLRNEYQQAVNHTSTNQNYSFNVPLGFPSEYANFLPDQKITFARREANTKAYRLACILYPSLSEEERGEKVKKIHTLAKKNNNISTSKFIGYEGWEKIYMWLCERIIEADKRNR